jgi:Tfp pilus assembly protein PilF
MHESRARAAKIPLYALVLFISGLSGQLRADGPSTPPSEQVALTLLMDGNFSELDKIYGAIQHAYTNGAIPEDELRADFRVFYSTDSELARQYDSWVEHSPDSYVAHLARGIYYKKIGQEDLGNKEILETSDFQTAGMDPALKLSDQELDKSLSLDRKPLLTYLHMINVRTFLGDQAGARALYDRAISLDPHSFIIRENLLGALKTRWGGSTEQMQAFLAECRQAGLSVSQVRALEAIVAEDEAWVHRYRDLDADAAIRDYEKAAELNPDASCLPCGPIVKAAYLLVEKQRYDEAIAQFDKVVTSDPKSLQARTGRAFSELQLNRIDAAVADFQFAADLGDAYAQDTLARMYLVGTSVPQDQDKAIMLLEKAAAQGYGPAINLLPLARNRALKALAAPGSKL